MSDTVGEGTLERWYRNRIGRATTTDEVRGYWIFVLGLVLGTLGILLFIPSARASALREWSIVFAAAGLVLAFAGPIVRLPLEPMATRLAYVGVAICAVSIAWFLFAFPNNWASAAQTQIIGLYSLGLLSVAAGGVLVPLLTAGTAAAATDSESGVVEEAETGSESEAGPDANAAADAAAERESLQAEIDRLRSDLSDAESDEADLAAQLRSLRTSSARFEFYEDRAGEYRWRLRHRNGNIIASSGEGYTARHNAQKGMQSVRRNALGATVLQIESESALPSEEEAFDPLEEQTSKATFELYEDEAGEYRYRLRHENGNLIAASSEGYNTRRGARTAIGGIREYAGKADYLRFDPTGFETYRDRAGQWRWRLVHRNGNILADSGEGYTRRRNARRAIDRIRGDLDELTFEPFEDNAGEYRWRLVSPNGETMADSGEGYADRRGVEEAIERIEEYAPEASVLDVDPAAFEIYEDKGGEYRWRLRHRNGNILADSGQGYAERRNARDGIESVKRNAPGADLEESETETETET
jgi:uncharacterized protein YegP (UPF0339 family)